MCTKISFGSLRGRQFICLMTVHKLFIFNLTLHAENARGNLVLCSNCYIALVIINILQQYQSDGNMLFKAGTPCASREGAFRCRKKMASNSQ